jgi:hypothetical protein
MVVVPALTIITIPSIDTDATAGLLLVYVKAPALLLEGAVRLKDASPKFFAGTDNAPIVGAMGDTTSDADTDDPPV